MPGPVLSTLHLILSIALMSGYYDLHFRNEKTEVQRGALTSPTSHAIRGLKKIVDL